LALNGVVHAILPARFHVAANLAMAVVVSGLASATGASLKNQGLDPDDMRRGAAYGVVAALPISAAIATGALINGLRPLYRDRQIERASARRAAYEVLLRIPIGTALSEEIIFRGALFGAISRNRNPTATAAVTAVLFGLWHVLPALGSVRGNAGRSGWPRAHGPAWIALSVGLTSIAGLALAFLRHASGSVVSPWLAHSAANSTGYLVAWLTRRRSQQVCGEPAATFHDKELNTRLRKSGREVI
jgi:membrane protease YdiL (CAAX protease family)